VSALEAFESHGVFRGRWVIGYLINVVDISMKYATVSTVAVADAARIEPMRPRFDRTGRAPRLPLPRDCFSCG
jgi:hypothetical protein